MNIERIMAKRLAVEDILISAPTSKKCRGFRSVDMRLESVAQSALLGSRCRKRPFYCNEAEETEFDLAVFPKSSYGDLQMKHAEHPSHHANTMHQLQTPTNFHKPRNSAPNAKPSNKRARVDCEEPADKAEAKAVVDVKAESEDCFNTFQFWRAPLPELDMSLLQELQKESSFDAMES